MIDNFINKLSIRNFKSIENLELNNFKRINLFIGRPNVGKSNILEALSLYTIPYLNKMANLRSLIRLENETELFFDGNTLNPIQVNINDDTCSITYNRMQGLSISINNIETILKYAQPFVSGNKLKSDNIIDIKKYVFLTKVKFAKKNVPYLLPPFGNNLLEIIESLPELKNELTLLLKSYNLKMVFDRASQALKIIKENNQGELFLLPYEALADTLRRIIFFKTAIASNQNTILLFEEPEAHAFPAYISHITQEIISHNTNQYFIATHSAVIVRDLLENAIDNLSIFIVDIKDHKTVVKALSHTELIEVYNYGVDLFYNNESYV